MSTVGQYLASLAYDLIFFSSDVQTTTIAMAITGSLCCSIMWAIVHVITLIHDPPVSNSSKPLTMPTGLTTLTKQHGSLSKTFINPNSHEILCLRCNNQMSDRACRYGMCSACCLGQGQCVVHFGESDNTVSMELRIKGPKGIDLSNSCMKSVPERLGFIGAQLTYLNLSGNSLTELPPDIGCLQGLQRLQLNDNCLYNIPVTLGNLPNLSELDLRNNQLCELPDTLCHLPSLKLLNMESNKLSALPDSVGQLGLLEELYVGYNNLTCLPSAIGNLLNLKILSARSNQLVSLPSSIGQLISLERLDLIDCLITTLPSTLGRCISLRCVNLCRNKLSYLPSQMAQLQQLVELYVTSNSLSSIPASMENMSLTMFEVSGNPLITQDTTVILSNGTAGVATFPPLMELVARFIVCKKVKPLHLLPHSLKEYLQGWKLCSQCNQPVFQYYYTRIRHGMVGKYHTLVPLKETLCSPHLPKKCPRQVRSTYVF